MKLKPIAGYEGIYSIREDGMVRAHDRIAINGSLQKAKWLKPSVSDYLMIPLMNNGVRKNHLVHRLCAIAFVPNPNNLPEVNHLDKNKHNNNHTNFEWVTSKGNKEHSLCTTTIFLSPNGMPIEVLNMSEFAHLNNLNKSSLSKVSRGIYKQHKGWTLWEE